MLRVEPNGAKGPSRGEHQITDRSELGVAATAQQCREPATRQVEDGNRRRAEPAGRRGHRIQNPLSVRQHLRPPMPGFAARAIRPREHRWRAAVGADALQN